MSELLDYDGEVEIDEDSESWTCKQTLDFMHTYELCPSLTASESTSAALVCEVWRECADTQMDPSDDPTFDDDMWGPDEVPNCSETSCEVAHR